MSESNDVLVRVCGPVDKCLENCFEKIGRCVAGKAAAWVLALTIFVCVGLGCGILQATQSSDLASLWIERGSEILDERTFYAETFFQTASRTEVILIQPKKGFEITDNSATHHGKHMLDQVRKIHTYLQTINVKINNKTYYYKDVCSRIASPPASESVLASFGGLPCLGFTPLQCFREGDVDYFLEGLETQLPSSWAAKPSYLNSTDAEIFKVLTSPACSVFSDTVSIPQNFMVGENTADKSKIYSVAITLILKSGPVLNKADKADFFRSQGVQKATTCSQVNLLLSLPFFSGFPLSTPTPLYELSPAIPLLPHFHCLSSLRACAAI